MSVSGGGDTTSEAASGEKRGEPFGSAIDRHEHPEDYEPTPPTEGSPDRPGGDTTSEAAKDVCPECVCTHERDGLAGWRHVLGCPMGAWLRRHPRG